TVCPLDDRDIGEVTVPVKELLDNSTVNNGNNSSEAMVDYQVCKPPGKPKGSLKFSYKFGEKTIPKSMKIDELVMAYPAATAIKPSRVVASIISLGLQTLFPAK
ncbi:DNA-directed RNA polymerase, partial [Sarracenia purpurea var. burkii]